MSCYNILQPYRLHPFFPTMWLRSHPQLYSLYNLFPYLMIHPVPSAPVTLHQHCVKKHIGKAAKPRTGECSRVCPNPPWDLQQLANGSPALCLDSWGGGCHCSGPLQRARVRVFCLVILSGCYRCHQGIRLLCSIMIKRMTLSGDTKSLSAPLTV